MKILVISGTGFISSCTCDRLLSLADEVIVLDTLTPRVHSNGWPVPRAASLSFGDEFYHGDTSDRDLMTNLLHRSDAVYHLAGYPLPGGTPVCGAAGPVRHARTACPAKSARLTRGAKRAA